MNNLITQLGGPTIIIFIGGIIAAIGAVWAAFDQNRLSSRLEDKNSHIIELNREIISLNKDISSAITGGDSFCYISPSADIQPITMLVHSGDHPIYDVSCRIVDLDAFEKVKGGSLKDILSAERSLELGGLAPQSARMLGFVLPTDKPVKRFNIFFSARNGFFTEKLRMTTNSQGEWISAIQVTRGGTDAEQVLLENISSNYPRNEDGNVEWD